jgi:hypothetical protein
MKTPFTIEQFMEVFKNYNTSVYPMQIFFYLLGITAIFLVFTRMKLKDETICLILSVFWIWIGLVYHLLFFTTINKAAFIFGPIFIIQGVLFIVYGIVKHSLSFRFKFDIFQFTGILFLIYALIIYPVLGYFFGHRYPYSPTFGLPCPSVIFTFGIFLFADKKIPMLLLIIPFLWSIIGFFASVSFGIFEDTGLLIAGVFGTTLIIIKNMKISKHLSVS